MNWVKKQWNYSNQAPVLNPGLQPIPYSFVLLRNQLGQGIFKVSQNGRIRLECVKEGIRYSIYRIGAKFGIYPPSGDRILCDTTKDVYEFFLSKNNTVGVKADDVLRKAILSALQTRGEKR